METQKVKNNKSIVLISAGIAIGVAEAFLELLIKIGGGLLVLL